MTGTMSPDGTSWTLGEPLGYGKINTVFGTATGSDGRAVPVTGTYTTVTPGGEVTTGISPAPGSTVGVAAPVIVSLGSAPADRAPIESLVHITPSIGLCGSATTPTSARGQVDAPRCPPPTGTSTTGATPWEQWLTMSGNGPARSPSPAGLVNQRGLAPYPSTP